MSPELKKRLLKILYDFSAKMHQFEADLFDNNEEELPHLIDRGWEDITTWIEKNRSS